jgi:hypothetical protein
MLKKHYTQSILRPCLQAMSWYSPAVEQLMLGTLISETNFEYLHQIHGPALGIYEIELATCNDNQRYLNRLDKMSLKEHFLACCFYVCFPPPSALVHNLTYCTLMARLKYIVATTKVIPLVDDIEAQAAYYKKYYNSSIGKGSIERYIELYNKNIGDYL